MMLTRGHAPLTISIHALREESDLPQRIGRLTRTISIHALREESDSQPSTLSLSGGISIHALREESDLAVLVPKLIFPFQSTLSVRRATSGPEPEF